MLFALCLPTIAFLACVAWAERKLPGRGARWSLLALAVIYPVVPLFVIDMKFREPAFSDIVGWVLLLGLLCWPAWRLLTGDRRTIGSITTLATTVAFMVSINLSWSSPRLRGAMTSLAPPECPVDEYFSDPAVVATPTALAIMWIVLFVAAVAWAVWAPSGTSLALRLAAVAGPVMLVALAVAAQESLPVWDAPRVYEGYEPYGCIMR